MKTQLSRLPAGIGLLFGVTAVALLTGCSALGTAGLTSVPLPGGPAGETAAAPAPDQTSITIELRQEGREPQRRQVAFREGMHVQEALEAAGAVKRFRRMNIDLVRVVSGQRQKLPAKYKHTVRRVDPLYDYALYAGDHLIVTEDSTTAFDDMLNSVTGPVTQAVGK